VADIHRGRFHIIGKRRSGSGKKAFELSGCIPSFLGKAVFQRWCIAVGLCLALTYILSPQFNFGFPDYKVGSIAIKDIKADRDFLVEDKASTEQKKTEALKEAPPVYDYDPEMPSRIGAVLAGIFLKAEEELASSNNKEMLQEWLKAAFENGLRAKPTDDEIKLLIKRNFSLDICNTIVKLMYAVYNARLIGDESLSGRPANTRILVHNISTQKETTVTDLSHIAKMKDLQLILGENANSLLKNKSSETIDLSVSLAEKIIRPNITFAKNATEQKKKNILEAVKPVFYKVQQNEMIVREGQKLTAGDLEKISALSKTENSRRFTHVSFLTGMFAIFMILAVVLFQVSKNWLIPLKFSNHDLLFMSVVAVLQIMLVKAGIFIAEAIGLSLQIVSFSAFFYVIPFSAGSMLVAVLLGRKDLGLVFSIFTSFLATFLFQDKIEIFLFSICGSLIAVYYIIHCKQRSAFFKAGFIVGCVNLLVIAALALLSGNFLHIETIFKVIFAVAGGVLSGIIVSGTVPLFEALFSYKTDIKLLELANLNQPIFQEMIISAPGTYHHSIIVASMVEAAAEDINANPLLAKVSAYYHDIGKIRKPLYFVENQQSWENKHDKLTPSMSSRVIISHVKEGCEMARRLKLGGMITDIIRQHHGTRLASYFFEKAKQEQERSRHIVLESDFRYPGPKPQSKEAGLVLLADIVEASSRTLKDPTPSRIQALIDTRFREIVDDGQLDDSELTFNDLDKIAESFTRILNGIFHHRIDYIQTDQRNMNAEKNGSPRKKPAIKSIRKSLRNRTVTRAN
jgi:putative nucleotidyltransferase with HDIG domain